MKRVCLWDNLKFFAILCIVLLHSIMPYAMDGMPLIKYVLPFINWYPMTIFAIISGYWYKERSFKELLLLFLWPCLLFSVINNILGCCSHFPNYFTRFLFKPGYAMWYLMALFLFSMVTKWVKRWMGIKGYLVLAILIAVTIGLIPIHNRYFDIQRTSSLFPCFAYGVFLKECAEQKLLTWKDRGVVRVLCAIIFILCVFINISIIHIKPSMHIAMTTYYGLNLKIALAKWMMIILRVIACTCLIIVFPDKEYWFTKYGSRTMNVYLLHAIPIFTISWGCLYNYRYEWFGLLSLFVFVPLLCTLFFSTPVDQFMKKILFSDYIKLIKNKVHR